MNPDKHGLPSRFALVNGPIVLPQQLVTGPASLVEGGRIAGVVSSDELEDAVARIDVGGRLVTPGLVDIYTHGA